MSDTPNLNLVKVYLMCLFKFNIKQVQDQLMF